MQGTILPTRRVASLIFALGLTFLLIGMTSKGPLISNASEYAGEIASSSAATYLSLRVINAALSFAEEVEVGGSLGVSGSVHPFKMLEPLDDAVERLSSTIFVVGAVSGIMAVILPVLGDLAFLLSGAALLVLAALNLNGSVFPGYAVLEGLMLRIARLGGLSFLVVLAFSISSLFADGISDRAWGRYERLLNEVSSDVSGPMLELDKAEIARNVAEVAVPAADAHRVNNEESKGLFASATERVSDFAEETASGIASAVKGSVDTVKGVISSTNSSYMKARSVALTLTRHKDDLVEALIGIFAAFMFKTIVFPLLILLGLTRVSNTLGPNRLAAGMS